MTSDGQTTNQLINETSPYLLQHAHNPVDWHPWGAEAFALAKYENKPLLISIGYSACHWCHVMERESFTNPEVAAMMNDHFVCIKVDREERPDVDQVYMDAVRMINGKGGWPLNCFALPDGRPFWGATYFQPEQLIQVLDRIAFLWKNQQEEVISQAGILSDGIREQELNVTTATRHHELENEVEKTFLSLLALLDLKKGGLKGSPKFPMPVVFSYLLRWGTYSGHREVCSPVWSTLDHMACGGIYDQLGGGFSRYSVDEDWRAPHFEKMLYDNAQLALLYMEGWQVSGNPLYRTIAEETLAFVKRELTSPEGAFFSSLDADSEGKEGRFYVWTLKEFRNVLGCESGVFMRYFGLGKSPNWEKEYHILQRPVDEAAFLKQEGLDAAEWQEKLTNARKILYDYRSLKPSPNLDDKVLTSWNALMMKSYAEAAIGLDRPEYLEIAEKNARFILDHMTDEQGRLMHSFKNGKAKINGFLEDYAYAIDAFISLYQATFHYPYLERARNWAHYAINHFYDEEKGLFFFTSDEDTPLVARLFELNDGVMPSPNSVMARSLIRLAVYFEKGKYREMVLKAVDVMGDLPVKYSASFSNWSILWLEMLKGPASAAFCGVQGMALRKELGKTFLPFVVMAGIHPELPLTAALRQHDQTKVYICSDNQCFPPTDSVKEMEELLHRVD